MGELELGSDGGLVDHTSFVYVSFEGVELVLGSDAVSENDVEVGVGLWDPADIVYGKQTQHESKC